MKKARLFLAVVGTLTLAASYAQANEGKDAETLRFKREQQMMQQQYTPHETTPPQKDAVQADKEKAKRDAEFKREQITMQKQFANPDVNK